MCKSIKKSCFVIALSFMIFAFYSGSVSSDLYLRRAAADSAMTNAPSNSDLTDEALQKGLDLYISQLNPTGGVSWTKKVSDAAVGKDFTDFNPKNGDTYLVEYKDKKGNLVGTPKKVVAHSSLELDVALPSNAELMQKKVGQ